MASSDDETESLPDCVENYYFWDEKNEPISFIGLPIQWREGEILDGKKQQIFLLGDADKGLQKLHKQVIAWRFDLSNLKPEISVLLKGNHWTKIERPRKSYEDMIRTVLVTVQYLHFLRKNPEASGKSCWDHLSKVFSLYDVRPSQNDLVDHLPLISEAVNRDDTLANSKLLRTFLEEKPGKRKPPDEVVQTTDMSGFIVDDVDDDILDEEEDEEEDVFDSVCAFCDNGGDLLCCEGRCMRSFHATVEAGDESMCDSLGYSQEEVDEMQNFFCKSCELKQHQCFVCGKLGSSDKFSAAEVFPCVNATCGYFYHPRCVSKLLHREDETAAEELEKKIAAGGSFTCPIHKCSVCKQGENKKDPQLQFAVCRRCPKSYHRKCLPRKIAFEDIEDEGIVARAWEGLLPNRILIYCLKHEIDEELGTPIRDHVKFPGVKTTFEKKKVTVEENKKQASDSLRNKEKDLFKKKNLALDDSFRGRTVVKVARQNQKSFSAVKVGNTKNSDKVISGSDISRKVKVNNASRKLLNENAKSISMEVDKPSTADENKHSLGYRLFDLMKSNGKVKPRKQDMLKGEENKTMTVRPATKKLSSSLPSLDADSERRLLALLKDANKAVTLEDVIEKHKVPSTHAYSSKYIVDKTITLGKLEGSVEAVRDALGKLEDGRSREDAEAVCGPEVLQQIFKWKSKLRVYLSPFLHGNRYTSFGRHFTKVEKLEGIVDKLHWYAQNGDMIVDFCCGANDFSVLMNKKLEEKGKKCSYKNFDIFQAKNDFNFEKRDWFTVKPNELPTGSKLIMGLNPPFGVKAALANKFIDKALEFNPKLIILIVPSDTYRLDKKKKSYDLIWEDGKSLSGKSFYLPGSVDENDRQMDQWNLHAPPLSLWSRRDWTDKHKAIAEEHGHLLKQQEESDMEKNHPENIIHDHPVDNQNHYGNASMQTDDPTKRDRLEIFRGGSIVMQGNKESPTCISGDRVNLESEGRGKNQPSETSVRKRKRDKEHGKGMGEKSPENKLDGGRTRRSPSNAVDGRPSLEHLHSKSPEMPSHAELGEKGQERSRPRRSPPNVVDGRSSLERLHSKSLEMPSHVELGENVQHFEPSISGSHKQFAAAYGGSPANKPNEMGCTYNRNGDDPYLTGTIHRMSTGVSPGSDYRARSVEEQLPGYTRDSSDGLGYRYNITQVEENFQRDREIRTRLRYYGQLEPDLPRYNFLAGHDSGYGHIGSVSSTYVHPAPPADLSYRMNTSAMQRYAPRLDELNHTRMNTLGSEPHLMNRNSFYDPRAPPPGYQGSPMGFAPGPHSSYSHQNSAGWLNE
ncbi:protein ENHANCED DOWNY MILDEW 2 [Castanea sativa]|uniref:protein ENHANCED DOWNY MILDEW 2 n=1 Tax=Castanea sativa TaxID=21020 RepID=UPI003F64F1EB